MALSYRARKRLALLILLVGLPAYVIVALVAVNWADDRWGRLPIWAEVAAYVTLGFLWVLPFRGIFRGIGQADPALPPGNGPDASKADRNGPPRQ